MSEHIRTRKMSDQVHDLPWTNDSIRKINAALDMIEEIHQVTVGDLEKVVREKVAVELEANACVRCINAGRSLAGPYHTVCRYWFASAKTARGSS